MEKERGRGRSVKVEEKKWWSSIKLNRSSTVVTRRDSDTLGILGSQAVLSLWVTPAVARVETTY
jgi:hypothetical protein